MAARALALTPAIPASRAESVSRSAVCTISTFNWADSCVHDPALNGSPQKVHACNFSTHSRMRCRVKVPCQSRAVISGSDVCLTNDIGGEDGGKTAFGAFFGHAI